jgi:hypothetical protein
LASESQWLMSDIRETPCLAALTDAVKRSFVMSGDGRAGEKSYLQ